VATSTSVITQGDTGASAVVAVSMAVSKDTQLSPYAKEQTERKVCNEPPEASPEISVEMSEAVVEETVIQAVVGVGLGGLESSGATTKLHRAAIMIQAAYRRKRDRDVVRILSTMRTHFTANNVQFRMVQELILLGHGKSDFNQSHALDNFEELTTACKFLFRALGVSSKKVVYRDQWIDFVVCNTPIVIANPMTKHRFCAWFFEEFFMNPMFKVSVSLPKKFFYCDIFVIEAPKANSALHGEAQTSTALLPDDAALGSGVVQHACPIGTAIPVATPVSEEQASPEDEASAGGVEPDSIRHEPVDVEVSWDEDVHSDDVQADAVVSQEASGSEVLTEGTYEI